MGISLKSSHLEQRINPDGAFRIFCHANCLKRYVAVLTSRVCRTKPLVQHARIIHMPWVHLLCGDWGHEGDRERTGNDFLMIENLSCPACNSQFTCSTCNSQFTCPACNSQFTCPACNSQLTCPACNSQFTCPACNSQLTCPACNSKFTCPACNSQLTCPACNSQFTCPACDSQFTCPACDSQATSPACNSQFTCPACEFLVLGMKIVNRMLGMKTENHTDLKHFGHSHFPRCCTATMRLLFNIHSEVR